VVLPNQLLKILIYGTFCFFIKFKSYRLLKWSILYDSFVTIVCIQQLIAESGGLLDAIFDLVNANMNSDSVVEPTEHTASQTEPEPDGHIVEPTEVLSCLLVLLIISLC